MQIFYVSTSRGCDKFFKNFIRFLTKLSQFHYTKNKQIHMSLNDWGLVAKDVVNSPIEFTNNEFVIFLEYFKLI
jgi:hypothetical protein